MPIEVEAKFQAHDRAPLDDLARRPALGPAKLGPLRAIDELDRYLDTADRRLAANGWACRLRTREGALRISLKGPPRTTRVGEDARWLHRRPELEAPIDGEDPVTWRSSPAVDRVRSLAGGDRLVIWLSLAQRRGERAVDVGRRHLGTLSLDEVRVEQEGRTIGQLWIVELELTADGRGAAVGAVIDELRAVPGLTPDPTTKLEHALALGAA